VEPKDQPSKTHLSICCFTTYLFIVDFDVTDPDCDGLIELVTDLVVDLLNSPWNDTPLFIVVGQSEHGKCLSSASLSITHDRAIVSRDDTLNNGGCRKIIDIILRGVVQDIVKLKLPVIQLIVHCSVVYLVAVDQKFLKAGVRWREENLLQSSY
jgi:hypothetical protein